MTKNRTVLLRSGIVLLAAASLIGCSEDNGVDYCKNHYQFHRDHLPAVTHLTISLTDSGALSGNLMVPRSGLESLDEDEIMTRLGDRGNIFTLESERPCESEVADVEATTNGIEAKFQAECGTENRLGKINITLFGHMPAMGEVVASVTTPATSKRFAISEQCDGPIFRLD